MSQLRIFTPEELTERNKPKRVRQREAKEQAISQFHAQLVDIGPGYGGELFLGEGEEKRKYRALLKEAATRAGLTLRFRPIKDKTRIEFTVAENAQRRRRGRPKKQSA